jgi:peptidoglycan/LPS O-acetylase OafA/YrhL
MYLVVVLGTIATARAFGPASDQPIAQTVAEALDVLKFGFTSLTTAPKLTLLGLNALALIGMAWTLSYEWAFYLILVPAATFCKSRVGVGIVLATGAALAWGDFHEHSEMVIWPVLQVIGRISYSVYLLQYLVIFNSTIIIYGHPHLFGHSAAILLSAAAMMILIVLVATATYRFIELPCIRLTKLLGSAAPAIAGLTPDLSETRHES